MPAYVRPMDTQHSWQQQQEDQEDHGRAYRHQGEYCEHAKEGSLNVEFVQGGHGSGDSLHTMLTAISEERRRLRNVTNELGTEPAGEEQHVVTELGDDHGLIDGDVVPHVCWWV